MTSRIEKYFLTVLLKVAIFGVLLIFISDMVFYPSDRLSLIIDIVILLACILAYFLRSRSFVTSTLIITNIILLAMFYQCLVVPINTNTSLSIILIAGFIISIMLKGKLLYGMHAFAILGITVIFIIQGIYPALRYQMEAMEVLTLAITFFILYGILTYSTAVLKHRYDKIHSHLTNLNHQLYEKSQEIEAQNEELIQIQENMVDLNQKLEKKVLERTQNLEEKNKKLTQYSYNMAHHLRGPIARLLGLMNLRRMENNVDHDFFYDKIEEQTLEIDDVVKKISTELEDD